MMINPIKFLGGLSLQTKALLIIAVFLGGMAAGVRIHSWKTQAAEGHSIKKQLKTSDTIREGGIKRVETTQEERAEVKIVYRTIKERIHDENDQRICFANITALQLWNDAISGENLHRPSTVGETAESSAIVATVEQVLTNATENFEICKDNSIKHNALIDEVKSLQGKMCVCTQ